MKQDGCGGWKRDYSGLNPRDLRELTGVGIYECRQKIEAHEILDEIEAATDWFDLKCAVLRLAQFVTGEK